MKLYCLSGLGVDKRAFIHFSPKNFELVHIEWITPDKNEDLASYSKRLFDHVNPEEDYSLIGVSFGGMVATEFAKIRAPKQLFLVSTISSAKELRPIFRFFSVINFHKILPYRLLTKANWLSYKLFGVRKIEHKALLKAILKDTDPHFLKWAVNSIIHWKNTEQIAGTTIHGTKDLLLPQTKEIDYPITKGGHFMIVTNGEEISRIVDKQ